MDSLYYFIIIFYLCLEQNGRLCGRVFEGCFWGGPSMFFILLWCSISLIKIYVLNI